MRSAACWRSRPRSPPRASASDTHCTGQDGAAATRPSPAPATADATATRPSRVPMHDHRPTLTELQRTSRSPTEGSDGLPPSADRVGSDSHRDRVLPCSILKALALGEVDEMPRFVSGCVLVVDVMRRAACPGRPRSDHAPPYDAVCDHADRDSGRFTLHTCVEKHVLQDRVDFAHRATLYGGSGVRDSGRPGGVPWRCPARLGPGLVCCQTPPARVDDPGRCEP